MNKHKILAILDHIFSACVVAPLVVGVWSGLWNVEDIYIFPNHPGFRALTTFFIGTSMQLCLYHVKDLIPKHFHPKKNKYLYCLVSKLFTIDLCFANVNYWKSSWYLLSSALENSSIWVVFLTVFVVLITLMSLKSLKSACFAPLVIDVDWGAKYFNMLNRFEHLVKEKTSLYIMDCLFSILVVGTLVVFVWRGSWIIVDLLLFPDNQELSAQGSLIIGYFIILIVFLMQPVVRSICTKLDGAARLIVADLFIIICLAGTINVWRGIWKSLDMYLLPDNLELSSWISLGVSLTLLILLGCSNSLLIRGVYIDAEEPDGRCVVLPCYYFRLIFQEEKLKKLNKKMYQIQQIEKSKEFEKNHVVTIGTISAIVEDNMIKQGFSDFSSSSDNGENIMVFKENCIN